MQTTDGHSARVENLAENLLEIDSFRSNVASKARIQGRAESDKVPKSIWIGLATAACVLIMFVVLPQFRSTDKRIDQIIDLHYSKFDDVISTRSANAEIDHLMMMYNKDDAVGFFKLFDKIEEPSEHELFYASQLSLQNGDYKDYINLQNRISEDGIYAAVLPWYHLVWSVRSGDKENEEIELMICNYMESWFNYDKLEQLKSKICF